MYTSHQHICHVTLPSFVVLRSEKNLFSVHLAWSVFITVFSDSIREFSPNSVPKNCLENNKSLMNETDALLVIWDTLTQSYMELLPMNLLK